MSDDSQASEGKRPAPPEPTQKNNPTTIQDQGSKVDDAPDMSPQLELQLLADHRSRIVDLRMKGWRVDQISRALGLTPQETLEQLTLGLASERVEPIDIDNVRTVELARLDRMHRAVWDDAVQGSTRAIRTALEISKRRSTIAGLDKPRRIDTHHTGQIEKRVQIYLPDNGRASDTRDDVAVIESEFSDAPVHHLAEPPVDSELERGAVLAAELLSGLDR